MSLIFCYANFIFKKGNGQSVLFLFAAIVLLGGVTGVIFSLPLKSVHTTSFKLKLATINDGVLPANSLISTRPVYVYSIDDLASLKINCVQELRSQNTGNAKPSVTVSNVPRGSEFLAVSVTQQLTSFDCAEGIGNALVNDQNRRLMEYVDVWKKEKDILEARLEQQDQRNSAIMRNAGQLLVVPSTDLVFEELYQVKWYLESARESTITVPPWGSERYDKSRLYLYGLYGILSAGGSLLIFFLALWLILKGHKRNSSAKNSND